MTEKSDDVFIEIENRSFHCHRELLIQHSDYFKAMLEGGFIEGDAIKIKLQGVTAKTFGIILLLLYDQELFEFADVLEILQAASMFQFLRIKDHCIEQLAATLHPRNCIATWKLTEQLDIKPLYLKARCMALMEFSHIKDMDYIPPLHLNEICIYLGHSSLNVENEFDVFETALKWWYEQNGKYDDEPATEVLLQLLSCVVYKDMDDSFIREMMTYPDLSKNSEIISILECILHIKNNTPITNIPEHIKNNAKLLWSANSRKVKFLPSILLDNVHSAKISNRFAFKMDEKGVWLDDKYRRERQHTILEHNSNNTFATAFLDPDANEFKELFQMDAKKCQALDGFKLLGYKEFILLFGGKFGIITGDWNYDFWVFDTFKEKWYRKTKLPHPRTDFETCVVGSSVYIIGGTGLFREIQDNMFWYNFKHDTWSNIIELPCSERQIKCCSFQNQLFMLDLKKELGFLFNETTSLWTKFKVDITDNPIVHLPGFTLFCYKDSIYIKGITLIEMQIKVRTLSIVSVKQSKRPPCFQIMESVVCNNIVYTLYMCRNKKKCRYVLEQYDLESSNTNYVFSGNTKETVIKINENFYTVNPAMKLFHFHHYSLVDSNEVVNDAFLE